jgi:hypothetical protein
MNIFVRNWFGGQSFKVLGQVNLISIPKTSVELRELSGLYRDFLMSPDFAVNGKYAMVNIPMANAPMVNTPMAD